MGFLARRKVSVSGVIKLYELLFAQYKQCPINLKCRGKVNITLKQRFIKASLSDTNVNELDILKNS